MIRLVKWLGATAGFNTVNGKYCCNVELLKKEYDVVDDRFNTVNGKYCCN